MGRTRSCKRCSGGIETCVIGNYFECSVCDVEIKEAKISVDVTVPGGKIPMGKVEFVRVESIDTESKSVQLARSLANPDQVVACPPTINLTAQAGEFVCSSCHSMMVQDPPFIECSNPECDHSSLGMFDELIFITLRDGQRYRAKRHVTGSGSGVYRWEWVQ